MAGQRAGEIVGREQAQFDQALAQQTAAPPLFIEAAAEVLGSQRALRTEYVSEPSPHGLRVEPTHGGRGGMALRGWRCAAGG